jgi:hypothetical protein
VAASLAPLPNTLLHKFHDLTGANVASLSAVLSSVAEVRLAEEERGNATRQKVVYMIGR